jgi:hypothetical protein
MPIDFTKLNLEVIDTNTNFSPDIYINATGITFTKRVVDMMGYPQYVQYLTDPTQKVFAIRAARSDGNRAVSFSKPRNEQAQTVSTNNKNIFEPVRKMMEGTTKPGMRYKVTGFMMDDNKTMAFYLPDAVAQPFRPGNAETEADGGEE